MHRDHAAARTPGPGGSAPGRSAPSRSAPSRSAPSRSAPSRSAPSRSARCRGILLAASASILAVSAHAAGGGGLPDVSLVLLLIGLLAWVVTSIAERVRSFGAIFGVLAAGQLALHGLLSVLGGAHASTHAAAHAGAHTAAHAGAHAGDPLAMLAAHAVATVLTAWLLLGAERGLRLVRTSVASLLPVRLPRVPPLPGLATPAPVPAPPAAQHALRVLLRRICALRGPPAVS